MKKESEQQGTITGCNYIDLSKESVYMTGPTGENVLTHRHAGESALPSGENSGIPATADAAQTGVFGAASCSARSLGHMSSDFSEFEKSLAKATSKVLYF